MNFLIIISFIVVSLVICSNFLYQKLMICIDEIKDLKRFNEDIDLPWDFSAKVIESNW